MSNADAAFTASIPEMYERLLVPMLFAPFAADIVERARSSGGRRILEIAAGTGSVTRLLASALPDAAIEATDLNEAMVACALRSGAYSAAVRWSTADAMALPFEDGRFDLAICQFGMMFFPDRVRAFREARRVLAPGGTYFFNVWDDLEHNDVQRIVSNAVGAAFPNDPPLFLKRTPHGHADPIGIERDLRAAGFDDIACEPLPKRCIANASDAATGLCEGGPLRAEILDRDSRRLPEVVGRATRALQEAFHGDTVDGKMRAYVLCAR